MPLRAVIFDVDGVLVQSMERHHEAYRRAFQDLRIDVRQSEVFANEGRRSREVIESIARARGLRLSDAELDATAKRKQEAFAAFGPLPLYPGVPELLAKVRSVGLKTAAVTGKARVNVESHLGASVRKLDVVVSADDVTHTKPHPEPYLLAMQKLGVKPSEAVVVENAPLGVRSAKTAGLKVVAVTTTNPRSALAEADWIVDKIADAWPIVEGLVKG